MSRLVIMLLCCGTMVLAGCFSFEKAKEPGGNTQVIASNYGWYLCNFIPLACGDADDDWIVPSSFFHNRVTMDEIQSRLIEKGGKNGRQVENLVWSNNDSMFLTIPIANIPLPIPYIITYREMQLSGELK